ncbi:hypothetical protein ROMU108268_19215 [Roseomonas mucosa]
MAVLVVLAIGLVVAAGVGDEVAQGEAVMRGHEVHRGPGLAAAAVEDLAGAGEAAGEAGAQAGIAAPEAAHVVAEAVVPFGEARRVVAELVAAGADVPGLRDQLDLGQDRVLAQHVEEAGTRVEAACLPPQDGAEVEAEAVDAVGLHPVAQAVGHHLQHARMGDVQRVAGAGVVDVDALVAGQEAVVAGVVEAPPGQGRAHLVALGRVVVHDVEDHLDPGSMELTDGDLDLLQRAGAEIGGFRRKEVQGGIAPVVAQALLHQEAVLQEGVHGQQLHCRDAQAQHVLDHARVGQAGEGAAQAWMQGAVAHGEAAQVRLVDHRVRPGRGGGAVVAPGEALVHHQGLGHGHGTVAAVEGKVLAAVADAVAEERVGPGDLPDQLAGIGVEQQLVRVEAVAAPGLVGAMGAQPVDEAGLRAGEIAVPDLVGAFRQGVAGQLLAARGVEDADLDLFRMGGEDREVDPETVPIGSERIRPPGGEAIRG